jgi:hypothetical protein
MNKIKLFYTIIFVLTALALLAVYFSNLKSNNIKICSYTFENEDQMENIKVDLFKKGNFIDPNNEHILIAYKVDSNEQNADTLLNICLVKKNNNNNWEVKIDNSFNAYFLNNTVEIEFVDVNFDGSKDIKFLNSIGYGGVNRFYNLLVNSNGNFITYENFENVANPEIDIENKVVRSNSKISGNQGVEELYLWKNGEIVLKERIVSTISVDNISNETITLMQFYSYDDFGRETFIKEEIKKRSGI